eukprot:m.1495935 g.1495935  ORF g.1495935 m.1495935 type:complete len:80 (-) comp25196_c0_seq129:3228-3467(-)
MRPLSPSALCFPVAPPLQLGVWCVGGVPARRSAGAVMAQLPRDGEGVAEVERAVPPALGDKDDFSGPLFKFNGPEPLSH